MFSFLVLMLVSFSGCAYFTGPFVNTYLDKVAAIQNQSNSALRDLNLHINDLSGEPVRVEQALEGLKSDREVVNSAHQKIEALETPEDAVALRDDLLTLYDKGTRLFDDLIDAGEYSLHFEPLRIRYEEAADKFANDMATSPSKDDMLVAINTYQDSIGSINEEARQLKPAVTSENSHQRFLDELSALFAGLSNLRTAIENSDTTAIQAAADKLDSSSSQSQETRQAINAARTSDIQAYNNRINEISALNQKAQQDQMDLQKKFARD